MKRTIRLRESELRQMITESVKNVLNELHSLTADSAFVQARDKYNELVANGQENTPQAQKLLRQMQTFKNYNDFDINSEEELDKKNEYGNSPSKFFNDITSASGVKVDPKEYYRAMEKYSNNGDKYDYNNMSQREMNSYQKIKDMPYANQNYSKNHMKTPQSLGYEYSKGKKGFFGIGGKKGGWKVKPQN